MPCPVPRFRPGLISSGPTRSMLGVLLSFLLLATSGCGESGANAEPPADGPKGIVFLLLDTVRADHMSVYGYERDTTPNLRALAERGVLFERAQAPAPWTIPTMASLLTGVYPSMHGAGVEAKKGEIHDIPDVPKPPIRIFHEGAPTLFKKIRGAGYNTFGFVANPLMGNSKPFVEGIDKLRKGFEPADVLVDWAVARFDEMKEDAYFLYLHFMDAHQPLRPPDDYLRMFLPQGSPLLEDEEAFAKFRKDVREFGGFGRKKNIESAGFQRFRELKTIAYDASIRYLDDQIGRLLEELDKAGLSEDVLFVVTADHGEELWDHWEETDRSYDVSAMKRLGIGHGHTLFQELVHVPLMFAGPGVPQGDKVAARVPLVDVGTTVLELSGVEGEDAQLGLGVSLRSMLDGADEDDRLCVAEGIAYGYELKSVISPGGRKLIWAEYGDQKDLLYDLSADPKETRNVIESERDGSDRLRELLKKRIVQFESIKLQEGGLSDVDKQTLDALGYGSK